MAGTVLQCPLPRILVFIMQLSFLPTKAVIGMIHFSALRGDPDFENTEIVLQRAKADLRMLLDGGVDAVLFENNFDSKKFAVLPTASAEHFRELVSVLAPLTSVPWGIAALWNDYELGFALCREFGGVMVRVPVFVDSVETVYGTFLADPGRVLVARREAAADNVVILADVQVKHAKMLSPRLLSESVIEAIDCGADAIVITGKWTGDPPTPADCAEVARLVSDRVVVFTGSGMTTENVAQFLPFIDGCIVGSAFKEPSRMHVDASKPNIVGPEVRYSPTQIDTFVKKVRE